jgi:predicted  nucleic acid-binding Zn ribbon protein
VKLMAALCYNPVHCTRCNLGVPPELIGMDLDTLRGVAYWRWIYDAIYRLWLDSEDYEPWAERELCDPDSRVNQLGLRLVEPMNQFRKCYYWLFQNETDTRRQPRTHCPICQAPLSEFEGGFFRQRCCENCRLLLSARRDS